MKKHMAILLAMVMMGAAFTAAGSAEARSQDALTTDDATAGIKQSADPVTFPAPLSQILFQQNYTSPSGSWSAGNTDAGEGYKIFDNFWNATGTITGVTWWGITAYHTGTQWVEGDPNGMNFWITFYSDDINDQTNVPSTLVTNISADAANVTYTDTGDDYSGFSLWEFHYNFSTPFTLSEGWMAIQSHDDPDGPDWLLWMNSPEGDGFSWQDGASPPDTTEDRSFQLHGTVSDPPATPAAPSGPTTGLVNESYTYSASTTDPDGDNVSYMFDWGDGTDSGWIGPYTSGATATASHTWTQPGDYDVTVKAKDEWGVESNWSSPTTVNISATETVEFDLVVGWNLITVPVDNDYNASSLGQAITGCEIVAYWNASAGMFQSFVVGITPGDGFAIEDGVGYFVYVNTSGTFSVTGAPLSTVAVDLYTGWNTIGWFDAAATSASSLAPAVPNCSIAAYWNATSSIFQSYVVGQSQPPGFTITRGMGVFVYVTGPGVWNGQGL